MNRYVLLESTGAFPYVAQVIDTESYSAPAVPKGSNGFWLWVPENTTVQLGWIAHNGATGTTFNAPTAEEQIAIAVFRTRALLLAALDWTPRHALQYKVDLGVATSADQALLLAFKQYVIALYEVKNQAGYPTQIIWPIAPF